LIFWIISYIIRHISLTITDIMNNLTKLINSGKTVFTKKDIQNLLKFKVKSSLDKFIYRAKKEDFLENPYYWIYTLKKYDIFEFACKLKKKSYISLETVLKKEWVIFQYYETFFLITDDTLEKSTKENLFKFNKIKDSILLNPLWLIHNWNYTIASTERAICDRIYLSGEYYFDNLSEVNFEKLEEISLIYNKTVIKIVKKLIQNYAK